jgi:hypothetical protein
LNIDTHPTLEILFGLYTCQTSDQHGPILSFVLDMVGASAWSMRVTLDYRFWRVSFIFSLFFWFILWAAFTSGHGMLEEMGRMIGRGHELMGNETGR